MGYMSIPVILIDGEHVLGFDLNRIENDNGFIIHHHFKWIELSKLNECNLLPNSIKEDILNDTGTFHYVIKED